MSRRDGLKFAQTALRQPPGRREAAPPAIEYPRRRHSADLSRTMTPQSSPSSALIAESAQCDARGDHVRAVDLLSQASRAGDAEAIAVTKALCQAHAIPYQMFLNRSDMRGGSTLGSMLSANMPMRAMDVGAAILAMHSARETMARADQGALERLVTVFFSR